jgi:hypothetical protein
MGVGDDVKNLIFGFALLGVFTGSGYCETGAAANALFESRMELPAVPVPPAALADNISDTGKSRAVDAGRPLTQNEREMLIKIFANGVDYSKVRIYSHKWWVFQPDNVAMSPDGNIYYSYRNSDYSDDFALLLNQEPVEFNLRKVALFVHEMVHVYQYQQGVKVVSRRLQEGGDYQYEISPHKDLNDYTCGGREKLDRILG